jgi:hypothetical protein
MHFTVLLKRLLVLFKRTRFSPCVAVDCKQDRYSTHAFTLRAVDLPVPLLLMHAVPCRPVCGEGAVHASSPADRWLQV